MIKLSILIPSLTNRKLSLQRLINELTKQHGKPLFNFVEQHKGLLFYYYRSDVLEIIAAVDSKEISTGEKRNRLLSKATGKYVCSIDDDDSVFRTYIPEILKACERDCDCIGIRGMMTTNGRNRVNWEISKDFDNVTIKKNGRNYYLRHTNHLAPVKREIALKCGFPDKSNAEDSAYSLALKESGLLKTETKIDLLVYHYKFQNYSKEYK